jgi:hypothetical protein
MYVVAIGFALGVAVVLVSLKTVSLRSQVADLRKENAALRAMLETDKGMGDEALRTELKTEIEKREEAEERSAAVAEEYAKLQEAQAAKEDSPTHDEKKDTTPPFLRMFENDEAVVASAKMQVGMQYGMLLADLKLPADVEDEVREILASSMADQLRKTMKAMQDGTMKDFRANQSDESVTEALRSELSTVLNADEMAVWEDYEANKGYYMLEQSYDMQLGMYAPSMSHETRDTVKQVLAEEMTVAQQDQPNPGDSNPDDWVTMQSDAMNRGLERLSSVLNEDEYAQVERFIQQQNENLRASQRMMQSMMGTDEDGAEDQ